MGKDSEEVSCKMRLEMSKGKVGRRTLKTPEEKMLNLGKSSGFLLLSPDYDRDLVGRKKYVTRSIRIEAWAGQVM